MLSNVDLSIELSLIEDLAEKCLDILCGDDDSHNIVHARKVRDLVLIGSNGLTKYQIDILLISALLHDVDDKKYVKTKNYANAREIMKQAGCDESTIETVIKIISLVSCSENGDRVPEWAEDWMIVVRQADRLEGLDIGRMLKYGQKHGQPLHTQETARVNDLNELYTSAATKEKYELYCQGVPSKSGIDHIYEKLLHVLLAIDNPYLKPFIAEKQKKLEAIVLEFGRLGTAMTHEDALRFV